LKKRIFIPALLSGIILICYFVFPRQKTVDNQSSGESPVTGDQKALIYDHIRHFPDNTQIAVSLIKNDSCIFYGVVKQNDTVQSVVNKDSLFEIGSVTKVFTATLLAGLVIDSTIAPEGNINDDLPFELNNNIKIRYLDLANHTSGLPRKPTDMALSAIKTPLNPYKSYDTGKLERYLSQRASLPEKKEKDYEYSNLGVGILGYTLCRVTESNFETLLKEKIFSKYGMASTTTVRENIKDRLVAGHGPFGVKTRNWDLASLEAAGGILSSASDMSVFIMAQFDTNNAELNLTRKSTFVADSTLEIGLAWHILKDKSGHEWYWHNGGTGGYRSSVVLDTEKKTGVVVLSNISFIHRKSDLIDGLCFELMKSL
jgi:CubicO group peptidase (beta-lactamase class C family)